MDHPLYSILLPALLPPEWFHAGAFVVGRAGDLYEGHEEDSRSKAKAVHYAPGVIHPMLRARRVALVLRR